MPDQTQATMLRRWAMQCAAEADNPHNNPAQRERLLKMRVALLDLATSQDWLDGHSTTDDLRLDGQLEASLSGAAA